MTQHKPVSLMRLETRNSLCSRMHFKLHVPGKGWSCPKGQAAMRKYNPEYALYILVCIFFSSEERSKDKSCKLWGSPAEVARTSTSTCGWKRGSSQFHGCYFCNPTTTFHTEPTPRQLFLLLYPKPNYSETSLQAPGQPEHIHQARGRRGNLSPLCLFYVLVALAWRAVCVV